MIKAALHFVPTADDQMMTEEDPDTRNHNSLSVRLTFSKSCADRNNLMFEIPYNRINLFSDAQF